jgi:hypothetical protein
MRRVANGDLPADAARSASGSIGTSREHVRLGVELADRPLSTLAWRMWSGVSEV